MATFIQIFVKIFCLLVKIHSLKKMPTHHDKKNQ
jgi:hypothetical protein